MKSLLAVGLLLGFVLMLAGVSSGIEKRIRSGVARRPAARVPKVQTPQARAKPTMSILGLIPIRARLGCGLHKLTRAERATLDAELYKVVAQLTYRAVVSAKKAAALPTRTAKPRAPRPAPGLGTGVIESKVDGEFEGWEGETIIKLMNGQIWQQIEYYYRYHYGYMPDVLVYRSAGGWKMQVEGIGKAVRVERLK